MQQEMELLKSTYTALSQFIVTYSFQILGAIIILIVGIKISGWLYNFLVRLGEKREFDITLTKFLANFARILSLVFVVIIAMGKFGISIAPFIAALGAVAFGSSLALQGPLSNYGAGIAIILGRYFVVGDTLTVKGCSGIVEDIRLAATILTNEDSEKITIPNKHIVGEILTNSFENKVVEAVVGISYDDDPNKAIEVIAKVLNNDDTIPSSPSPLIGIEAFADSSIAIGLRYWVPTISYFETQYRINLAIYNALHEANITIPYPQRDIHMITSSS